MQYFCRLVLSIYKNTFFASVVLVFIVNRLLILGAESILKYFILGIISMHRSSFLTKIVAIIAIWGGIQVFFWLLGVDSVAAATLSSYVQDKIYIYNSILNGLYLLIWPALALAWFALDNSMVYWSLFGLDAPLFLIWNIIKNIANFILWFMVLFEILKNFFTTGEQGKKAFDVIKKALIAWVLIQASWFLMWAIIDISTIATYSVGGMPITILGWSDNQCKALADIRTLPIGTKVDFTASNQNSTIDNGFQYYYYINKDDGTKTYFSPCEFYNDRWVIGQKFWGTYGGILYEDDYCIMPGNQFAYFSPWTQLATNQTVLSPLGLSQPSNGNYTQYKDNLNQIKSLSWWLSDPQVRSGRAGSSLIFDARTWAKSEFNIQQPWIYLLNGTGTIASVFDQAPMLKDIIAKAEWFVGVLITLYKSILNFVSFNTGSSSTDTFILFLEALLKVWFGLALLIPLILLSIALVIRVGYIWMFIALSPIIALKIAFDDNETMKWIRSSIPIIKEKLGDVIRIIFAPVLITFAVSFCLVFMTALITSINNQPSNNPSQCLGDNLRVFESMNVKTSNPADGMNKTYQIAGIAEMQQSAFGINVTGPQRDIFGWILINLFGVAIVWLLLMTVIESVFKGTPVGDWKLRETAGNMLASLPFIPIPTSSWWRTTVGAGTLGKVAEAKASDINAKLNASNIDEILGRNNKKQDETETASSATTTTTTASTINTIGAANTGAVASAAAVWWLGSTVDMSKIDALKDNAEAKKLTANDISKSIITNNDFYSQYRDEVNKDDTKKAERWSKDAQWINTNRNMLSQDEFKTILERKDDLATRLVPQVDASRITIGGSEQVLSFVLWSDGMGQYEFKTMTDADKTLPEYIPLVEKTWISDRTQPIATIR